MTDPSVQAHPDHASLPGTGGVEKEPQPGLALPPHPGHGSGTELWLARHAEVHEDWRGKAYGGLDVPLSRAGEERTEVLASGLAKLEPALVLSSPLQRAELLGARVAQLTRAPLSLAPELAEIDRGSWQGMTVAELHADHTADVTAFYADPWSWRGHGGESDEMLAGRLWPAISAGIEQVRGGRLLVTTHYNVIRVLVAGALGLVPAASFSLRVDPGTLTLLVDTPDGWNLVHSNLEDPMKASEGYR